MHLPISFKSIVKNGPKSLFNQIAKTRATKFKRHIIAIWGCFAGVNFSFECTMPDIVDLPSNHPPTSKSPQEINLHSGLTPLIEKMAFNQENANQEKNQEENMGEDFVDSVDFFKFNKRTFEMMNELHSSVLEAIPVKKRLTFEEKFEEFYHNFDSTAWICYTILVKMRRKSKGLHLL